MVGSIDSSGAASAFPDDIGIGDIAPQLRDQINDFIEQHTSDLDSIGRSFEQNFPHVATPYQDQMQHTLFGAVDMACDQVQELLDANPHAHNLTPTDIDQMRSHMIDTMKPKATLDMVSAKKATKYRASEMGDALKAKGGVDTPSPSTNSPLPPSGGTSNFIQQIEKELGGGDDKNISTPQSEANAKLSAENTAYQDWALPQLCDEFKHAKGWVAKGEIFQRLKSVFGENRKPDAPALGTSATPKPKTD